MGVISPLIAQNKLMRKKNSEMKRIKLIFIFFMLGLFMKLEAQKIIGKVDNNVSQLTADKNVLLKNFNRNLLAASNIKGDFTDVSIVNHENNYYLVFKGATYKSTLQLSTQTDATNATLLTVQSATISCTTSDCVSESFGCIPNNTSCTPCANKGKCTKTVSQNSLLD